MPCSGAGSVYAGLIVSYMILTALSIVTFPIWGPFYLIYASIKKIKHSLSGKTCNT